MGSALDEEVDLLVVAPVNVTKKVHLNFDKCWTLANVKMSTCIVTRDVTLNLGDCCHNVIC